ncbi:MAG: PAS domain S-box protein, partial [Nitrospira sp. SB0661_bin_20]|nr:PAS domain S-box protein [Nitrospira sp. SB0661_bin_20]
NQIDKTGRFVHVNQTELEKLGFTLLEMLSMHLWDILPAERKAEALDYVNRLPTQPRSSLETVFLTRDGTPIDVEIHSTALIDSDTGDLVYTRAFVRDVTERKALQRQVDRYTTHLEQEVTAQTQQLSESEKRYRVLSEELEEKVQVRTLEIQKTQKYLESLLENANDVIYTLDRDQRFTYVNNKVENWGYRKEDLLGRPFLTLLAKRHRSRRLKDILEFEVKQEYEVEVISQSGELRSVLVSVSPLENERHNVIGVLGIARDITDRKLMEEQFRNAERLASVGKLAAGVAHEINNPLGGILNCLYNIRKGTLPSERQEEYFTYMEDGLRRAQKIVRQLLDFSQQHEPEFSMNDVNGLVDRVLVLTNHAIAEKRLQLHKVYDDDLPPLFVDPQMIEQVLTNLILNAVQATNEGGSIILQTRTAHERCEIDVGDTGSGIDPEVRPHIFDPFFTTKGTGEGTGLGLSVSLGIVERHGGQLTVESEVGKGTVFTVSLPLSANRAALVKVS